MSDKSETLNSRMDAHELRESWQGRALSYVRWTFDVEMQLALTSMLADNYDDALPFLLHAVYGSAAVHAPFYCSNPKINKAGQIVADMIDSDGAHLKGFVVFENEREMESSFRRLGDKLKLNDADRIDLFICVRHWVKADQRLDPAFDRRDPDAKRLVLN